MEEEFRALLKGAPSVAAIVAGRVNFGTHPQGQPLPGIVLNTVSDQQDVDLDGPVGVGAARVQVDCYAADYGAAKWLGRAVLAVLNGYAGGGFQGIFHAGSRDGQEGGTNEADRPSRVSMDFLTTFNTEG